MPEHERPIRWKIATIGDYIQALKAGAGTCLLDPDVPHKAWAYLKNHLDDVGGDNLAELRRMRGAIGLKHDKRPDELNALPLAEFVELWKQLPSQEEKRDDGGRQPVAQSPSGRVKLFAKGERPIVDGKERDPLTNAQYDVVLALLKAGENGLTKDQLEGSETGRGGGRKTLYELAKKPLWKSIIQLAGKTGKGYRIR